MGLLKAEPSARGILRYFSTCILRLQSSTTSVPPSSTERPPVPEGRRSGYFAPAQLNTNRIANWELERLRVVPKLSTFYGGNPIHDDNINKLSAMVRKHKKLPTKVLNEKELQAFKFVSFEEYKKRTQSGTRLKIGHHKELQELLNRLRSIEPELMPREVIELLNSYTSVTDETQKVIQKAVKTLDEFGRANTVGKRKRAEATISMVKGEGQVIVNGESFSKYFAREIDRIKIAYPFKVVSQEGKYNLFINVQGGGISGQAEAAMYGIAKALVVFNPLFKSRLRLAGLMTRDARKVERKKPGKVKARKSPTWVKR